MSYDHTSELSIRVPPLIFFPYSFTINRLWLIFFLLSLPTTAQTLTFILSIATLDFLPPLIAPLSFSFFFSRMADHYSLCLLGLMDRLWFHQIILFSETSIVHKTLKQQIPLLTGSLIKLPIPSSFSLATSTQEEISKQSPPINLELKKDNYLSDKEEKEEDKVVYQKDRQTRSNLSTNRARSQSFSPSNKKRRPKSIRNSISLGKLKKSMSCRSLGELEMEEVKGFMDLGFIFKKENVSPRMITVVPGLLRLGLCKNDKNNNTKIINNEEEDEMRDEKEEEKEIMRPYLSEAWLIKRPDSPLLNLRLPRVYAAADMKKHLKFWARTVASVIQQES